MKRAAIALLLLALSGCIVTDVFFEAVGGATSLDLSACKRAPDVCFELAIDNISAAQIGVLPQ